MIVALFFALLHPALSGDPVLVWDANTDPIAGYKAYWGTASRIYTASANVGNSTTYTVVGLAPGTYFFAVTAYDAGAESGYSNEVSATIPPKPPTGLHITTQSASLRWFGVVLLATTDNPASAILRYHKVETGAKTQTVIASPAPATRTQHRAVLYFPPGNSYYSYAWTVTAADGSTVSANGTFQTR